MKPFLFLLFILPAGLNAQQPSVSATKSQLPVGTIDFSSSAATISAFSTKIQGLNATIKSAIQQMSVLRSSRAKLQSEITSTRKQIADIGTNESKNGQKAELEKKLAELTNQLNEIDKQISSLQKFTDAQIAELNKLEDSIDQQRKKMEEVTAGDRQKTEKSKQGDEMNNTATAVEEKALAYAHVRIIIDSLPIIVSSLTLAERNLVSGFNSRFNSDAAFRSATTAYLKHSKASNYFGVVSKAGSFTDLVSRLLNVAREELVILSRN